MTERTVLTSLPNRPVLSALPQASAFDAACKMTKANCGSVLVLDDSGALAGIFTERDLLTRVVAKNLDPASTPLAEVMTLRPRQVRPDLPVHDAVFLMKDAGIRHLPVVAPSGVILGVFSMRDALPAELHDAVQLAEHLEHELSNVLA